jgi:hypothetical protein
MNAIRPDSRFLGFALLVAIGLAAVSAYAEALPAIVENPAPPTTDPSADLPEIPHAKIVPGFETPPAGWTTASLADLGLTDSMKRYNTQPTMTVLFPERSDEVLAAAQLRLELSADPGDWAGVQAMDVLLNDEPLTTLARDKIGMGKVTLPIDARLLGPTNSLTFRLGAAGNDVCATQLEKGKWRLIRRGFIDTTGKPLPLRNDLALLPLPFFDPKYDRLAKIAFVFPAQPDPQTLTAAGITAAWFGLQTGSNVEFEVHIGKLPPGNAVVFLAGDQTLPDVTVPPATSPTVRMIDHPAHAGPNRKLLVLRGATAADLLTVAKQLALTRETIIGESASFDRSPEAGVRLPYDAPRWLPAKPAVTFGEIEGGDALVHKGLVGGTMSLKFRIAPDLFTWPRDLVRLDIHYSQIAPRSEFAPTITIELNGAYLTTLPRAEIRDGIFMQSVAVDVHRSRLRGFNRLEFHVSWPNRDVICRADPEMANQVSTTISPESTLHFENVPHFMQAPDVATFVEDGFPYTRLADLSETVVAVSDRAAPGDLGAAFSAMAHFAAVTGWPGVNVEFVNAEDLPPRSGLDKDILLIGNVRSLKMLEQWRSRLPVQPVLGRLYVHPPNLAQQAIALLGGRRAAAVAETANAILTRTPQTAVVAGCRSPLMNRRVVTLITALDGPSMPALHDFMGNAVARNQGGDLLLVSGENRWRFTVGPQYGIGRLVWYTEARWISANHWLVLIPSLFLVVFVFAMYIRRRMEEIAYRRLHLEGDE